MKRFSIVTAIVLSFVGGTAFAQTASSPSSSMTPKMTSQQPGLAATTSDDGNKGTGASSAMIGTGNTQGKGVMSPQAPAFSHNGATGANPSNPGGTSNAQ